MIIEKLRHPGDGTGSGDDGKGGKPAEAIKIGTTEVKLEDLKTAVMGLGDRAWDALSPVLSALKVPIKDGDNTVLMPMDEARKGWMRNSKFTQGMMELSNERKKLEEAMKNGTITKDDLRDAFLKGLGGNSKPEEGVDTDLPVDDPVAMKKYIMGLYKNDPDTATEKIFDAMVAMTARVQKDSVSRIEKLEKKTAEDKKKEDQLRAVKEEQQLAMREVPEYNPEKNVWVWDQVNKLASSDAPSPMLDGKSGAQLTIVEVARHVAAAFKNGVKEYLDAAEKIEKRKEEIAQTGFRGGNRQITISAETAAIKDVRKRILAKSREVAKQAGWTGK